MSWVETARAGHEATKDLDLVGLLLWAQSGRARYAQSRALTELGNQGYWEIITIGEEPCEPYLMHGGFWITTQSVVESRLTPKGEALLGEFS